MQKAHLYEAVFLVNQGIDQTVRGLVRLRKAACITEEIYAGALATLEHARAQTNLQFFADMQVAERRDAERYEQRDKSEFGRAVEGGFNTEVAEGHREENSARLNSAFKG